MHLVITNKDVLYSYWVKEIWSSEYLLCPGMVVGSDLYVISLGMCAFSFVVQAISWLAGSRECPTLCPRCFCYQVWPPFLLDLLQWSSCRRRSMDSHNARAAAVLRNHNHSCLISDDRWPPTLEKTPGKGRAGNKSQLGFESQERFTP